MYVRITIRFVILVLLQVLVLNQIHFIGYVNPYLYVLFILLLPFETPGWLLLLLSFVLGLSVDIFSQTPGMHAAASVFAGFLRPSVIRLISSGKEIEPGDAPGIRDFGFGWFFMYSLIIVFSHHLLLGFIEIFRFSELLNTLMRVLVNTAVTMVLIIISQYLFYRKK